MNPFGSHEHGSLKIDVGLKLRWSSYRFLVVTMAGTAQNEDADFIREIFAKIDAHYEVDTVRGLIIDMRILDLCYSQCIKALMDILTTSEKRPETEIIIGKALWQVTSVRAMANIIPQLKVISFEDSLLNELRPPVESEAVAGQQWVCRHINTKIEEFDFFAPTGNGSIVTKCICQDCGFIVTENSEYFC